MFALVLCAEFGEERRCEVEVERHLKSLANREFFITFVHICEYCKRIWKNKYDHVPLSEAVVQQRDKTNVFGDWRKGVEFDGFLKSWDSLHSNREYILRVTSMTPRVTNSNEDHCYDDILKSHPNDF